MKKVLIYEANSNQALSIAKYIKKHSNYYVIGLIEKNIKFNKKFYDKIIIEDFKKIDITEYDYILPMGANSTYLIVNKYKNLLFDNGINFSEKNLIVYNKTKILEVANNLDIPIPKTYYKKENIKSFPCFYKEDFENGGGMRGIANNINDIPKYNKLIFQEYIDTPSTYGVGFLAKNGEILTYIIHKEVISYPQVGGSAVVIEEFKDKRLLEYTKILLKELNYSGWGLAEFKYCNKREDFVFMEINGKFWASIEYMLINNSKFLNYILGIEYKVIKVSKILFINRLFAYPFIDIIKNFKYLFGSYIVKESSVIYQLIRKIAPNFLIYIIKRFAK